MKTRFILTEYTIRADLPEPLTAALIADLHESGPEEALKLLRKIKPDLILAAGDTFERHGECRDTLRMSEESLPEKLFRHMLMKADDLLEIFAGERQKDPEAPYRFLREAGKIAPVFLSVGNHEWYFSSEDRKVIKESGATLLDNKDCRVHIKGAELILGGLSSVADLQWLDTFSKKKGYKLLLCHHPEYYDLYLKDKDFSLILSGHAHGGQIRIGSHGIYAPGQGLFPAYTRGLYHGRLLVTAGCSNTASVPRWGNPCEVVKITLKNF